MVYRDLPMEEAEKRFAELTVTVHPEAPKAPKAKVPIKRKVVKLIVPKSK